MWIGALVHFIDACTSTLSHMLVLLHALGWVLFWTCVWLLPTSSSAATQRPARASVLYIVVDDLRVELPMYGQLAIQAPHLMALAKRGMVFDRAFCNQPVCRCDHIQTVAIVLPNIAVTSFAATWRSPSRNSFMTSRRPDKTLSWNFKNHFREVGPEWTTLPSHFLHHRYVTLGTGKLYHEGLPPNGDGNLSWTDSAVQFSCIDSGAGGAGSYCALSPNLVALLRILCILLQCSRDEIVGWELSNLVDGCFS